MSARAAGRVGRPHGLDGSFYVESPQHALGEGTALEIGGRAVAVVRRGGTDARPLLWVSGVVDRDTAEAIRGQPLVLAAPEAGGEPEVEGEWDASDLIGCRIPGLGSVRRVVAAPSCDLLEVGDEGMLVPMVSDAIRRIDTAGRTIEVDRRFLGLDEG
ncbi:MAG TPA: hypothetical protein VF545_14100 [Thermoleophilaceae bacterium]